MLRKSNRKADRMGKDSLVGARVNDPTEKKKAEMGAKLALSGADPRRSSAKNKGGVLEVSGVYRPRGEKQKVQVSNWT